MTSVIVFVLTSGLASTLGPRGIALTPPQVADLSSALGTDVPLVEEHLIAEGNPREYAYGEYDQHHHPAVGEAAHSVLNY